MFNKNSVGIFLLVLCIIPFIDYEIGEFIWMVFMGFLFLAALITPLLDKKGSPPSSSSDPYDMDGSDEF